MIVVVGAGPAGVASAVQLVRLGLDVRLLDRTGSVGGLARCAWRVENYPGLPPVPGTRVAVLLREHLQRFGVEVERAEVTRVQAHAGSWRVGLAGGEVLAARGVVLAVGTEARPLPVPGGQLLAPCAPQHAVGDAAVVGGGEAALDQALRLAGAGARVSLLVRGEHLRATGRLPALVQEEPRVETRWGVEVERAEAHGPGVRLHLAGGGTLRFDAAVACLGRRPVPLLDGEGGGRIVLGSPGLHVVGDARTGTLGQLGMAVGDGLAAAQDLARRLA